MSVFHHHFARFAEACCTPEPMLREDSSTMALLRNVPGAVKLVSKLHQEHELFHLQDYTPLRPNQIKWSDVKDSTQWVIFGGPSGSAAVKGRNDGYYVWIATSDADIDRHYSTHGGRTLENIKREIGGITSVFVSTGNTNRASVLKTKRKTARAPTGRQLGQPITIPQLAERFKPLLAKFVTAAEADMRGMVNNMIKSGAYQKAQAKMNYIDTLHDSREQLEDGEISNHIMAAFKTAVIFSAAHYYPDMTGELRKGYRSYEASKSDAQRQLLADIGQGDNKKLLSVLGYFQRFLVHKS